MRNLVFSACLLLFGGLPAGLNAAHPDNHDIERVLTRHQLPAEALSVITVPLQPGLQGSAFNADKAVNPASVMKLVTTYAALDTLGPTYTWKTDLLTDGKVSGDT
ncbi:MAG: D-alanyl-D-alanine carboxypeptidase, partial [Thiopseudomonas sp.]